MSRQSLESSSYLQDVRCPIPAAAILMIELSLGAWPSRWLSKDLEPVTGEPLDLLAQGMATIRVRVQTRQNS